MVRKKKKAGQEEQKPWCFYCDRQFNDESILIQHQKSRHFKCSQCHKKLNTAQGLAIHCIQVHKLAVDAVPNAKPGREAMDKEIFGMAGVPSGMEPGAALPDDGGEGDEPPAKMARLDSGTDSASMASAGSGNPHHAAQGPYSAAPYYNPPAIPIPAYGYPGYPPFGIRPSPGFPPHPHGIPYPGHPGYPPGQAFPPPYGSAPMAPPSYPPFGSQPPAASAPITSLPPAAASGGAAAALFPISGAPAASVQPPAAAPLQQLLPAAATRPPPTVQPPPAMPGLFPIAQPVRQPPPVGLQAPPFQGSTSCPLASEQASQQLPAAAASTPGKVPPEMGFVWDDDSISMEEQRASSQKYASLKPAAANGSQKPQPASGQWSTC
ncbi:hypothetical protein WJX84_011729 [Apatococcus fuscideae]|uniref:BED-type domain-containing protein n=1 Tax=Apatococcus fuscideae TaxID=2026836 RepID=A0AAW1SXA6_9CHLO